MTLTAIVVILIALTGALVLLVRRLRAQEEQKAETLAIERRLRQRYDHAMNWPPRPEGTHSTPWKNRRVS